MRKASLSVPEIPNWIILIQCLCFSVLYAIWALPETISIRNGCLIIGALIGAYEVYQYRYFFERKGLTPALILVTLFVWMTLHLFFLSNDYAAQYEEYKSIWKRAVLGVIFAFGLGVITVNFSSNCRNYRLIRWIAYIGLIAPLLIYFLKYFLTLMVESRGWIVWPYFLLYNNSAPFYIPKTSYVCFCLSSLCIALGLLVQSIQVNKIMKFSNLIYLLTIFAVCSLFYLENIKNGLVYSTILMGLFILRIFTVNFKKNYIIKIIIVLSMVFILIILLSNHLKSNPSWNSFFADAKVAYATEQITSWKYGGAKGYPDNHLGNVVAVTNYERIAWAKEGLKLIIEYPLGYGLVEGSFGRLGKVIWPESDLTQTHSGWIDLALGIGLPGLTMIIYTNLFLLFKLWKLSDYDAEEDHPPDSSIVFGVSWLLFGQAIMWFTTEISQKVYFESLLFWIAFAAGLYAITKRQSSRIKIT